MSALTEARVREIFREELARAGRTGADDPIDAWVEAQKSKTRRSA
jgi:hypothetical protein